MSTERMAPFQGDREGIKEIPWELHVRIWRIYAALGHRSQSAYRIAQRGGFGVGEAMLLLAGYQPYGHASLTPITERQRKTIAVLEAEGAEA